MKFSDSNWGPHLFSTKENITFERPLGATELGFYWDGIFERTADTLRHTEVHVTAGELEEVISLSRITETWKRLKNRFPLLGACLEERGEDSIFFVVSEGRLRRCQPDEITFSEVSSLEEAGEFVDNIVNGEQLLNNDLLARIFVLRQKGQAHHFHFISYVAHCITDGMANISILKTFLNELCESSSRIAWNLEDCLALSVASEDLDPNRGLSLAKKRWRRAIADAIGARRAANLGGGHSLPRKITQRTPFMPAHSRVSHCTLSPEATTRIFLNCRKNQITFGNAYPVLGQVALCRVLLRRYLIGEISEAEWEFRKKERMFSAGPLNLRPFLDKQWFEAGGSTNVSLSINFFVYSLPFLPLGFGSNLRPGMELPSFEKLLSKQRFLYRSNLIRNQANNFMKHPLFLEIATTWSPRRVARMKGPGLQLRREGGPPKDASKTILSPVEQASAGIVFGNGGSSMGNVDRILPLDYPLDRNSTTSVRLELVKSTTRLRCRPAELYLGAATSRHQLHLHAFWDGNVFEDEVVKEWLNEVKMATEFYLSED